MLEIGLCMRVFNAVFYKKCTMIDNIEYFNPANNINQTIESDKNDIPIFRYLERAFHSHGFLRKKIFYKYKKINIKNFFVYCGNYGFLLLRIVIIKNIGGNIKLLME